MASDRVLRDLLQRLDDAGDIGGRLRRPVREVANLLGDHGEPASGVAGSRRLNRGVQRQQIRPLGDQVDGVDDDVISLVRLPISRITVADCAIDSRSRPMPWIER